MGTTRNRQRNRKGGMSRWALLLALSLCLPACASEPEPETTAAQEETEAETPVLRLSIASSAYLEGSVTGDVLQESIQKLREWSGGTMEITLYGSGRLGGDDELIPGAAAGTLSIVNSVSSVQSEVVPESSLLGVPGLFEDYDTYNRLMEGPYFEVLKDYYAREGLELLACFANSYRELTTDTPIHTLQEAQGVRIRTLNNPYQMLFWESIGFSPSYLAFSDLYMALYRGDFQAQENPFSAIERNRFYEVQKYVVLTHHTVIDNMFVMNKEQYDALTPEQQELLARFFEEVKTELLERTPSDDERLKRILEESGGMEMIYPDEAFMTGFRQGTHVVLEQLRLDLGAETVDTFLAALEAVS